MEQMFQASFFFPFSLTRKRLIAGKFEARVLHFRSVSFQGATNIPFLGFCSLYLDFLISVFSSKT